MFCRACAKQSVGIFCHLHINARGGLENRDCCDAVRRNLSSVLGLNVDGYFHVFPFNEATMVYKTQQYIYYVKVHFDWYLFFRELRPPKPEKATR